MAHEIIGSVQELGCNFEAKMFFAESKLVVNLEAVKVLGITIALDEVIE